MARRRARKSHSPVQSTPADTRRQLVDPEALEQAPSWLRLSQDRVEPASGFDHTAEIPPIPRDADAEADLEDDAGLQTQAVSHSGTATETASSVSTSASADAADGDVPARVAAPAEPALSPEATTEVHAAQREVVVPSDALEVRVPVMEERLQVEKRPVVQGEVMIDRRVTEEPQTISVEVVREQLRVHRRTVAPRPLGDEEMGQAFVERTLHVPTFGERAIARKQPLITGEVVVHRTQVPERQSFSDVLRRERVDVEEDYSTVQPVFHEDFKRKVDETGDLTRTFADAEPNYRRGYHAARESRFAGRDFAEVEPELREEFESAGQTRARWKQILDEVRAGFTRARDRS